VFNVSAGVSIGQRTLLVPAYLGKLIEDKFVTPSIPIELSLPGQLIAGEDTQMQKSARACEELCDWSEPSPTLLGITGVPGGCAQMSNEQE
jgi:hypothetical protein